MRRSPSQPNRNRTLVLGLGNPLVGDDSFGPKVIERLRSDPPEGVDLQDANTDLLSWIEEFPGYDLVVLVDALLAGDRSERKVIILSEDQLSDYPHTSPSVHQLSPLLAVRLFRQLHPEAHTRIMLVALQTDSIRLGSALDEETVTLGRERVVSLLPGSGGQRGSTVQDR